MIKKLYNKYKELINYVIFGVLTTVVSLVSYWLFNLILGENLYLVSNIISWVLAVIFAYFTNKLFVFESKSWKLDIIVKEAIGFFGARIFSLLVEEFGLWLLIDILGMDKISINIISFVLTGSIIAKIIMQVIVVILNYVFSKLIVFRKRNKE